MAEKASGVYEESGLVLGKHQVIVNLRRNNLNAIRTVINVGESLSEFVRAAVLSEIARRRAEDEST